MARDHHIDMSLDEAERLALEAMRDLDGRNGDPSKRSSWLRERKLARLLFTMIKRAKAGVAGFEVPYP